MRIPLLWYRQLRAIGLTCAEYTTGSKQTKKPQHATEASENISLTKDLPHFLAPQGASQAASPPVPQTCSALVAAGREDTRGRDCFGRAWWKSCTPLSAPADSRSGRGKAHIPRRQ